MDYGIFAPIQVAAIHALNGPQDCVADIRRTYQRRRDVLCDGLTRAGWPMRTDASRMSSRDHEPRDINFVGKCFFSSSARCQARMPGPAMRSPTTSGVAITTENTVPR